MCAAELTPDSFASEVICSAIRKGSHMIIALGASSPSRVRTKARIGPDDSPISPVPDSA